MKNIRFSRVGKVTFYLSFLLGTMILISFILTKSEESVMAGLGFVLIAAVVNISVFFIGFLTFITDIADKKAHGNSALLLLMNIPIAVAYFLIFCHLSNF